MTIEKLTEFASESDAKNTEGLTLTLGFPRNRKPVRQWFNWMFNSVTAKINEIIDDKLDLDANAVSATKLATPRKITISGATSGNADFDGSGNIDINVALNNFSSLKSQNGYKYLGDGTLIQWGTFDYALAPGEIEQNFTFPVVFPNSCLNISLTRKISAHGNEGDGGILLISSTTSSAKVSVQNFTTESTLLRGFMWIAIGC